MKQYTKKFLKNDVENSFLYMLNRLEELWKNVKFNKLKNICRRDSRLPDELRKKIESTNTLGELFTVLSDSPPFCNWLEIRILKSMADVADISEAIQMITIFEKCVYCRKCSEFKKHFKKQFINPDHFTKVTAKLNDYAEHIDVAKLIEYCQRLESVLQISPGSSTLVSSEAGCLEFCFVIPEDYYLHSYEVVKSCFLKLRPFNIQYLQIGSLSKIYTTNLTKTTQAKLLLATVSSLLCNNCKFTSIAIVTYLTNVTN